MKNESDQLAKTPEVLKPPFKRSVESERLENYLAELEIGRVVSYDEIEKLIDEDPQRGAGYSIVRGVRERLIKQSSAVWFVLPGVGLKRASTEEILEIGDSGLQSVKRKTVRTGRVVGAATSDYSQLDNEGKREFNFLMSVVGALGQFFTRSNQKQVKNVVSDSATVIESTTVLKMFSGEK